MFAEAQVYNCTYYMLLVAPLGTTKNGDVCVYVRACVGAWPLICDVVLDYNEIPMLPIACVCICMYVCVVRTRLL